MSSVGYCIARTRQALFGVVKEYLARDGRWYIATNEAGFKTMRLAVEASERLYGNDREGAYIEGPQGGKYYLNGHAMK